MSDPVVADLLAEERATRERAWRELYETHFDRVYRLASRFGVREADVEDITQRIFLIAHQRLGEVEQVTEMGAWLRGIGVRVVSDYHRWYRVRALKRWLLESSAEAEAPQPRRPDEDVSTRETRAQVAEVLASMSTKLREVLVLLEIEQCTPSEVATLTGIPLNTVRSRSRLAREQFQRIWERRHVRAGPGGT